MKTIKPLFWGASILALLFIGCDSDDDSKDVKAVQQQSSAQGDQNGNESAPNEGDDAGTKPSTPSTPGASENDGNNPPPSGNDQKPPSGNETKTCDPACPNGQACIEGKCEMPTDDCQNTCDDNHVCLNGICIAKSEPEPAKSCNNDSPCNEGYSCINGECVLPVLEKECSPECKAGFSCVDGACVEITASDNSDKKNCNKDVACDPSAVCVSDYYCVELCGEGENIYNKIEIIDELGVSQGVDYKSMRGFNLLKDKDALNTFISDNYLPPIDGIDFTKDAVLAIYSENESMGMGFELLNACDISGVWTFTTNKFYCITEGGNDALEWKWILLRVPKDGQYDVKFESNDHYCVKP